MFANFNDAYPHATHILDFYHVAEKLAAAQAADAPASWLPAQYARLWAGQSPALEQAVAELPGLAAPVAAQFGTYLATNRTRLRYDQLANVGCSAPAAPLRRPTAPC